MPNTIIGFVLEIIFFIGAGVSIADNKAFSSMAFLIAGLILAGVVGRKIQQEAVEKYKRENE